MSGDGTTVTTSISLSRIRYGQAGAPPQDVLDAHVDQNLNTTVEIDTAGFVYGTMTISYQEGRVPLEVILSTDEALGNVTGEEMSYDYDAEVIYDIDNQWNDGDGDGDAPTITLQPHQTVVLPMWIQILQAVSNTEAKIPADRLNVMTWEDVPQIIPSPPNTAYSGPEAANCDGTKTLLPFAHLPFTSTADADGTDGSSTSCVALG